MTAIKRRLRKLEEKLAPLSPESSAAVLLLEKRLRRAAEMAGKVYERRPPRPVVGNSIVEVLRSVLRPYIPQGGLLHS
jgi:hypothetical protein